MTLDQAVALSLLDNLPRPGLTARLVAADPELLEIAAQFAREAAEAQARADAAGIRVLAWNDARFPVSLLAIPDCPPAIWYRGTLACLDAPCVAIVGSRAASAVAVETAERLGAGLAALGITVVSGLARGVDSSAHRGALHAGRTSAVLGSGVDRIYPAEHAPLAARISEAGLVLSEYAPGVPPMPAHFPLRNRLISGLSRGVVVIEASDRSGSLITAACALEQGRDVMAVPGNVLSGRNKGGHALIRDGATIVECADDIVQALGLEPGPARGTREEPSHGTAAVSRDPVLRRMELGRAYDLDALTEASGLDPARLLCRLIDLELEGSVRRVGGGRFMRQERTC
jgi:DNA processing protein